MQPHGRRINRFEEGKNVTNATRPNSVVKRLFALVVFIAIGIGAANVVPSAEIAWVTAILLLTIFLFAFEIVPVDVAAICIMVLLGLSTLVGPYVGLDKPLVSTQHLFDGFASNAVISIIAVMIIGAGLDKTGLMNKVAGYILKYGGTTEKRVIPLVSSTVGFISSFMQNVGAAALFLPVISRISARSGIPLSRLAMPMGFCAILGGTMTMIGSSPLILLNDLILTSNQTLSPDKQMGTFELFAVTPVGVALVITGILYFVFAGRYVLPVTESVGLKAANTMEYFEKTYGVGYVVNEVVVPAQSPLVGIKLDDFEPRQKVRVIGIDRGDGIRFGAAALDRSIGVVAGSILAVLATPQAFNAFAENNKLTVREDLQTFGEALVPSKAGIAELVLPPNSSIIGKSARDLWLRRTYGLSLLAIHRGGKTITREGEGVRNTPLQSGDVLVVHTTWQDLAHLEKNPDFVVITTEYPHEELRPHKVPYAVVFFLIAISLVLFSDLRLSVALFVGALGMILSGVLTIDEAYQTVSWKSVFLLASLIPLGVAVENTGTAAWIAEQTLYALGGLPTWVLQAAIALLATFFTLVMSNVGATVLLVPLAVNIAVGANANPAIFALTVAIATSNSFMIPTHQVNALIMGPANYRVLDFMRAGGGMSILFLVVSLIMLNVVF